MSRTHKDAPDRKHQRQRRRNISVRAVRRDTPDVRKLSRALLQMAMEEAAAEAAAQQHEPDSPTDSVTSDEEPHHD